MKRFSNILLVVSERTDNSAALKRGVKLTRKNQARLCVCAIVDSIPSEVRTGAIRITPRQVLDVAISKKREWLEDTINSVATDGVSIDKKVLIGKPFVEIIRKVLESGHDLVIKSADADSGVREVLFGSTDKHLMRKCPCPVWIVKPTEREKYLRILAAVDQDLEEPAKDGLNRQILEISTSMALAVNCEAHIVHAWEVFGESLLTSHKWGFSEAEFEAMLKEEATERRRWLKNLVKHYATATESNNDYVLDPHLHVIKGPAQFVVSELARELSVDLMVMGTVARTGLDGFFMGNTAESILSQLDCSVLTIKPPGFTSPVTLEE